MKKTKQNYFYIFISFALLFTLLRIFFIYNSGLNLAPDEAQYWDWGKELAFGYYSKPPIIPWLIALSTSVCGDLEFCIRLPSPLLHFFTSIVIYQIGKKLFDSKIAIYSGLIYLTLPGVTLSAALMSTDAALLLFWALAVLFFIYALENNKLIYWLLAGAAAGFGMLSKYTMIVFPASVLFYFFATSQLKRALFGKNFWLAAITAALVFLPNIMWNYQNSFVSLLHTGDNLNPEKETFNIDKFLEFFASQFAVFGPILFGALLFIFVKKRKQLKTREVKILLSFIIPILLITFTVALLKRAHGNWAAVAYVAASVFVCWWAVTNKKEILLKISLALHIICALIFFNFNYINSFIKFEKNPFARLEGWSELGIEAKKLAQKNNAAIFSDERENVASLSYYARTDNKPALIYKWNSDKIIHDHYDMTSDIKTAKAKDFIFVSRIEDIQNVKKYFASTKKISSVKVDKRDYNLYLAKGFKGY